MSARGRGAEAREERLVADLGPFEVGLKLGHGGYPLAFIVFSKHEPSGEKAEALQSILNRLHRTKRAKR